MEENFISRLGKYMDYAGLNDNKVTVQCGLAIGAINSARKRNKALGYENIAKLLYTYKDLNARWLLTGEGEMLVSESVHSDSEITQFLKNQNKELMEKIDSLNREVGDLQRQLSEMKKEYAHWGIAAESADVKPYGLVK